MQFTSLTKQASWFHENSIFRVMNKILTVIGIAIDCLSSFTICYCFSFQNWYDYQYVCVQVIDFLKKKDFVQHALKHIGTSAITDLVLRLMQCVDSGEIKHGILEVIFLSFHCSFCHFSTSKGGVFQSKCSLKARHFENLFVFLA